MKCLLSMIFFILSLSVLAEETTGPWIEGRRYDFRYITTYEVKKIVRPMANFPWIMQDCYDEGSRFAQWSKTISYNIVYSGSISFKFLGLGFEIGGERGREVEFSFQRWVTPVKGIRAKHILQEEFENWIGQTKVEYRYADGLTEMGEKTYSFSLTGLNYGISTKREILEICQE